MRTGPIASVECGDARALPIGDETVDAVLTSPPYCTRIDYAIQTRLELAVMNIDVHDGANELRRNLMGTTSIRTTNDVSSIEPQLPDSTVSLLESIRVHRSHRSEGYYYRNFRQYFDDSMRALREIYRVLRPGGSALMVVQTSYYKEIEIDLPRLVADMARQTAMNAEIVGEIPVGRVMTSINSSSRRYAVPRRYRECVVQATKSR